MRFFTKKPSNENIFITGKFYRDWIKRDRFWGYVVFPIIGVLNMFTLVSGIVRHYTFGIIAGLFGLALVLFNIISTPRKIRGIKRRWQEMDAFNQHHRNLVANLNNLTPKR